MGNSGCLGLSFVICVVKVVVFFVCSSCCSLIDCLLVGLLNLRVVDMVVISVLVDRLCFVVIVVGLMNCLCCEILCSG